MRRTSITALLLVVSALVIWTPTVWGHADLASADPRPGDVLDEVPSRLVARFTQDLKKDRTSIELRDADGQTVARGGKVPDRARVQRIELPELEPGRYEVRWVTFSAEGNELARGKYRFTVSEAALTPRPSPDAGVEGCPSPAPIVTDPESASPSPAAEQAADPTTEPVTEPISSPAPITDATPAPCPSASPEPVPSPSADPTDASALESPRP